VLIAFLGPQTMTAQRFTRDGAETLERYLLQTCGSVTSAVQEIVPAHRLQGLLLGGGYGRGEGGVLRTPAGDQPYNDLEFYVFVRGPILLFEPALRPKLHEAGERLGRAAGIDVEFKVLSLKKLCQSPVSMFYYDLVSGHRWLVGAEQLLDGCEHHRDASRIPLSEAARLLMNRCSGLLFSAERLGHRDFAAADADFVGRNLAKAQLGFGDAVLAAHGQYHWSCLERFARLRSLHWAPAPLWSQSLRQHHAAGVEFKLHPVRSAETRESLLARHSELNALAAQLWLWLESRRLGAPFRSVRDYAFSRINKCPETDPVRNRLINFRTLGPTALLRPSASRYPRERLFHSLSLLLLEPAALAERDALRRVQSALQTTVSTFPELVQTYRRLWNRFN
jgi:hypothetical protein